MPQQIQYTNGFVVNYGYSADGVKQRVQHPNSGLPDVVYCGNVIYEGGAQKFLLTEEGYVDLTNSNTYYYYLKDHQGNNRVVINGSGTVMETNHYYPFGGVFSTSTNVQPYKYNGKELDTKNGLNWYDYGARHYDAVLGRWFAADPLAEKYYAESPYTYCGSNPVNRIDLFGMDYWSTSNPDEINRFWSWMSQNGGNGIESYSFMTDSWNRMTDKKFLEAYEQALTYNDQTNKLYSSYVTYENGEFVVNGVSVTAVGLFNGSPFWENLGIKASDMSIATGLMNRAIKGFDGTFTFPGNKYRYLGKQYWNGPHKIANFAKGLGFAGSFYDALGLFSNGYQLFVSNNWDARIEHSTDIIMSIMGMLPGGMPISLYWSLGGKELQKIYTEQVVYPLIIINKGILYPSQLPIKY